MSESDVVQLRRGRRRSDGSVRFVVQPVEKVMVALMAIIALALLGFVGPPAIREGAPWWTLFPFVILPFVFTFRVGFDLNVENKTIRIWRAWGPVIFWSATLHHLNLPHVHTATETNTLSDGREARVRVTRLHWGSRHIRATLDKAALSELMAEASAVVATSR